MKRLTCVLCAAVAACLLTGGAATAHVTHVHPLQLCNFCILY